MNVASIAASDLRMGRMVTAWPAKIVVCAFSIMSFRLRFGTPDSAPNRALPKSWMSALLGQMHIGRVRRLPRLSAV